MLTKQAAHRKDTRNAPATFTHQHFRTVAAIIRKANGKQGMITADIAHHFADALAATNPNFNRHRFLMACGGAE
jgi:hypothetical protein